MRPGASAGLPAVHAEVNILEPQRSKLATVSLDRYICVGVYVYTLCLSLSEHRAVVVALNQMISAEVHPAQLARHLYHILLLAFLNVALEHPLSGGTHTRP